MDLLIIFGIILLILCWGYREINEMSFLIPGFPEKLAIFYNICFWILFFYYVILSLVVLL